MSNQNTIDIDILINTSKSAKSLKEQKEALKGLREGLDQVREGSGAFELLTDAANDLTGQMDNLKLSFEEVYGEGVKPLTTQIGELEDRLYQMAIAGQQNTQEFKDLTSEAARLKLAVRDVDDSVDSLAVRGRSLEQFTGAVQGIAGAFAVAEGAAALFGAENEDFEKTMTKLTGVMAVMQGLQEVQNQLTTKGTVLNRVYNAVLKANPIFILLGVITAVIGAWKLFGSTTEDITDKVAKLNSNLQLQQDILEYNTTLAKQNSEAQLALAEAEGASAQEILDLKLDLIEQEKLAEANKWKLAKEAIAENTKLRSDAIFDGNEEAEKAAQAEIDRNKQLVDAIELDFKKRAGYANKYELEKALLRKQFAAEELEAQEEATEKSKEEYNKRVELHDQYLKQIKELDGQLASNVFDLNRVLIESSQDLYKEEYQLAKLNKSRILELIDDEEKESAKLANKRRDDGITDEAEYMGELIKIQQNLRLKQRQAEFVYQNAISELNNKILSDTIKSASDANTELFNLNKLKLENAKETELKLANTPNERLNIEKRYNAELILLYKDRETQRLKAAKEASDAELKILEDQIERTITNIDASIDGIASSRTPLSDLEEVNLMLEQATEESSVIQLSQLKKLLLDKEALQQKSAATQVEIVSDTNKSIEQLETDSFATRLETFQKFMEDNAELIDSSTQLALDGIDAVMELENRKTEERLANIETEKNAALNALDDERALKRALASEDSQAALAQLAEQRTLAEERQAIEDEYAAKARQEKKDQWVKQKRADVTTSIINGALAVSRALASAPPPLNFVLAGISGVAAGVQTGLIASQPTPIFRRGGILDGPSHENGGILTQFGELEGGEAVINKKSTKLFAPMLSAINEAGGGKSFAPNLPISNKSSNTQELDITRLEKVLEKFASKPIKTYVNESEITTSQNNVKKLRERNTF